MPRKPPPPDPQMLVARIESFDQTYYISEYREHQNPVGDEAIIEIIGRIERLSPKLKQHLYQRIDITLACAQSYASDAPTPQQDKPSLLVMNLTKSQRSFMAYLPTASFWSIPRMIDTGRVTHIEARFEPIRYGSGILLSINLTPESKLDDL